MNTKTKPMQEKPAATTLVIERVFNATPEKLWSYWTDPIKYAKWFNPSPADLVIHEFDVRVGGKIRFDMPQPDGNKNPQSGVFHKLDPYKEIVSGEPDQSFLLTVKFQPVGTKTRVRIEVIGVPAEYHAMATKGWGAGLDKLEKRLAEKPQGFTIERTFKAPAEKVWKMWTTKEGLQKWWALSARDMGYEFTVRKIDVRVGGSYDFEMKDAKQTLHNHGTYNEVVPNKRLGMVWNFDIFLQPSEKPYDVPITIVLEPVSGGTKMTFTQGPLASPEHTEGSRQGVVANFEKLAKALQA
jgi:uncharacterized protein YndB with AHSA1/START domain